MNGTLMTLGDFSYVWHPEEHGEVRSQDGPKFSAGSRIVEFDNPFTFERTGELALPSDES